MKTLGNLTLSYPAPNLDEEKFYWDSTRNEYTVYPLYERYIKCEITDEEYSIHKKEYNSKNCYFCEHTINSNVEGSLDCEFKGSPFFAKKVDNLTICEKFVKINEVLDEL